MPKTHIAIPLTLLLAGVVAAAVWLALSRDTGHIPPAQPADPGHRAQAASPVDTITSGRSGEAHGKAIETANLITRSRAPLADADASRLLDYIAGEKPRALADDDWQHLVNSVLNALRANPAPPVKRRLSRILATMAESHPDAVVRLYALQHISFWFPLEPDPTEKRRLATLLANLSSGSGTEAGTATMVMSDLQRQGQLPGTPQQGTSIGHAALRLAADKASSTEVRVTALHTLTDRRTPGTLPEARRIADDTTEHIILRKAAIFAIGRLGTPAADTARLKRL